MNQPGRPATNPGAPIRPVFLAVLALAVFLPFEDFLLKWLPISDRLYSYLRLASDVAVVTLFAFVTVVRLRQRGTFPRTNVGALVLALFTVTAVSIIWNRSPVLGSLINFRTLVRYIPMLFTVVLLGVREREALLLVRSLAVIGLVQSILGVLQFFGLAGPPGFWLPRPTDLEIAGYTKEFVVLTKGVEQGAVFGAFGHTVAMALFLLVVAILMFAVMQVRVEKRRPSRRLKVLIGVLSAGILVTYSRAALLAFLMAIPTTLWVFGTHRSRRRLILLSVLGMIGVGYTFIMPAPAATPEFVRVKQNYVNPFDNIRMIFGNEYLTHARSVRLWVLFDVGSTVLTTSGLVGHGPDEEFAKQRLVSQDPGLVRLLSYAPFEDVYWVALFAYYGPLGVFVIVWLLYRIGRAGIGVARRGHSEVFRSIGLAIAVVTIVIVPYTFLVRTFEFRTFSFYYWLLAGVTIAHSRQLKQSDNYALPSETAHPAR